MVFCVWAKGWTIGVLGFDSRRDLGIFLFTTASRMALEPSQFPVQLLRWAPNSREKWHAREADHPPPSNAEVRNLWSYTFTSKYILMA